MPNNEKLVYLDSSDYSRLAERNDNSELEQASSVLTELADSEVYTFVFSAAHLSEMAPTKQLHAKRAESRTNTLSTLCKRNALISFDKLITAEISNLTQRQQAPIKVLDANGTWFPEIDDLIAPLQDLKVSEIIKESVDPILNNRKMRRTLERTMQRKGKIRKNVESIIGKFDIDSLVERFPMKPKNAITLKNYLLSKATRKEAEEAFLESLRDPVWMMRWFSLHHDKLGAIGAWVRKPAQDLIDEISTTLIPVVAEGYRGDEESRKEIKKLLSKDAWLEHQNGFIEAIVTKVIQRLGITSPVKPTFIDIDTYCPGISTCLRGIHDSLRNSLVERPRQLKTSDFVDAIHSLYIPYVSYFSTDNYMSKILKPHATRHNTTIITDITKIPQLLK